MLRTARNTDIANKKKDGQTKFPDFICDNGIIEHFQVFADKERKKDGAVVLKDRNAAIKDLDKEMASGKLEATRSFTRTMSYENLKASFQKNWIHHIERLDKYDGNKNNVCFLIESECFGLVMESDFSIEHELGIHTGKIIENYIPSEERFSSPLLGRCKELLDFIYQYKDKVQYVIFTSYQKQTQRNPSGFTVEIIKTDKAQYIANLLMPYPYRFSNYSVAVESHHAISLGIKEEP